MIYRCYECGLVFNNPHLHTESQCDLESGCPECGGAYSEVVECEECGAYKTTARLVGKAWLCKGCIESIIERDAIAFVRETSSVDNKFLIEFINWARRS